MIYINSVLSTTINQYTKVFQCDTSTFTYTNKFNQYNSSNLFENVWKENELQTKNFKIKFMKLHVLYARCSTKK